ncbi:Rrf2 family transcriptional regulator [bacterium AH-315-P13]|nr:Rrf2 family transcriptional regulator [bacterium AH-315-P13]MBN4085273.1 Rrf2 family transcriptional regulator [Flavobacteriaceae bacterium AH-315-B10]
MLSSANKYVIRSVLYLALYSNESKKIGIKKIADKLEAPQPFLAKLLQQLTKDKLVSSTKGPSGGFYLSNENKENTIWDIIISIEGTKKFDQCFLGLSKCTDKNPCPVHYIVSDFKEKILDEFKDKTISQFADEIIKTGKVISLKKFNILDG